MVTAREEFPQAATFAAQTPPTAMSTVVGRLLDALDTALAETDAVRNERDEHKAEVDKLKDDVIWQYVSSQIEGRTSGGDPTSGNRRVQVAMTRVGVAEADADRLWQAIVAARGEETAVATPVGKAHLAAVAQRTVP